MTTFRQVAHATVAIAVILLIGVFAVQAFPQTVGADHSFVVLSGSMEPAISTGDVVIVSSVPAERIQVNDVITYRRSASGTPVTHRVIEVDRSGDAPVFVTKGDANEDADPGRVAASDVLGRTTFVIPYVGYVVRFANTQLGRIALIGVPFGVLVLTEAVGLILGRRSSDPTDERTDDSSESASGDTTMGGNEQADTTDAGPSETTASSAQEPTDDLSVTTTDLRLTSVVTVLFAAFAGWMAYQDPGGLTIGVTVAAVSAVILIALVHVAGEPTDPDGTPDVQATDGGTDTDTGPADDEDVAAVTAEWVAFEAADETDPMTGAPDETVWTNPPEDATREGWTVPGLESDETHWPIPDLETDEEDDT